MAALRRATTPPINLSRDYDETALAEQKAFLKELGPFRSLAAKDSKQAFLSRVRALWFLRWPLQLGRYLDYEGMIHREEQIWKAVDLDIMWAGVTAAVTPAHRDRGWRRYLTVCEARQGIYHSSDYMHTFDNAELTPACNARQKRAAEEGAEDVNAPSRPRPRPRPIKKARIENKDTETENKAVETVEDD